MESFSPTWMMEEKRRWFLKISLLFFLLIWPHPLGSEGCMVINLRFIFPLFILGMLQFKTNNNRPKACSFQEVRYVNIFTHDGRRRTTTNCFCFCHGSVWWKISLTRVVIVLSLYMRNVIKKTSPTFFPNFLHPFYNSVHVFMMSIILSCHKI